MWLSVLRIARGVLTFGITIPVVLIVAVFAWFWLDKTSAVRHAVDEAMTQAVAGAELNAASAKAESMETTIAELRARENDLKQANATFEQKAATTKTELKNANERIADLEATPVDPGCRVNSAVLGRLRNK